MSTGRLPSELVIVQSPFSFTGSARRLWRLTWLGRPAALVLTVPTALSLIVLAWCFVLVWYVVFGVLVIPWRLFRRGARRRRQEELRHREVLDRLPPR